MERGPVLISVCTLNKSHCQLLLVRLAAQVQLVLFRGDSLVNEIASIAVTFTPYDNSESPERLWNVGGDLSSPRATG